MVFEIVVWAILGLFLGLIRASDAAVTGESRGYVAYAVIGAIAFGACSRSLVPEHLFVGQHGAISFIAAGVGAFIGAWIAGCDEDAR